ncbi:MAG: hypothetical protein ACRBN8_32395 [Nannocystales bacterium]
MLRKTIPPSTTALVGLFTIGCSAPGPITPTTVAASDSLCVPIEVASTSPSVYAGERGTSVELLTAKAGPSPQQFVASGAPRAGTTGAVTIEQLDVDGLPAGATWTLTPAVATRNFGAAMLAVDVIPASGDRFDGEELFITAPSDNPQFPSVVELWGRDLDGWTRIRSGTSALTGGVGNDLDFSAQRGELAVVGTSAISSAGSVGAVELFDLSLTSLTDIDLASPTAVGYGDFDGNGLDEIAVGQPTTGSFGVVTLATTATASGSFGNFKSITGPFSIPGAEFGASLEVERGGTPTFLDRLLVGAPEASWNGFAGGSACLVDVGPSGIHWAWRTWVECIENIGGSAGDRFGETVALGNFNAIDSIGGFSSAEAQHLEVAVGAPDFDGGRGRVQVFNVDGSGVERNGGGMPRVLETLEDFAGVQPLARFGAALAGGFTQDVNAHPWTDLVVGAPLWDGIGVDEGSVTITKAHRRDPLSRDGTYTVIDSNSTAMDAAVTAFDNVLCVRPSQSFTVAVRIPGTSTTCVDGSGNPVTFTLPANEAFCVDDWDGSVGTNGDATITRVGATYQFAVTTPVSTLSKYNGGSTCAIPQHPFVFSPLPPPASDLCE